MGSVALGGVVIRVVDDSAVAHERHAHAPKRAVGAHNALGAVLREVDPPHPIRGVRAAAVKVETREQSDAPRGRDDRHTGRIPVVADQVVCFRIFRVLEDPIPRLALSVPFGAPRCTASRLSALHKALR